MVHFPWYMTVVIWFSIKASLHTCEVIVFYRVLLPSSVSLSQVLSKKTSCPWYPRPSLLHSWSFSDKQETYQMERCLAVIGAKQASLRCGGCQGLPVLRHLIYAFQMWKKFPGGVRESKKAIQIRMQKNLTFVFGPITVLSFTTLSPQDKAESGRSLGNTARRSFTRLCSPL